jgi:simple sugar transport system permease protein
MMDALAPLIASAIVAGTPLMLAALGLLVNEKSGVINLGSEGMMLVAAVAGFAVALDSGSPALGFAAGAAAGMSLAAFFAWLTVWLGANQVATGLALSLFGVGASAYLGLPYVGETLTVQPTGIPLLKDLPFVGRALFQHHPMVYVSLLLCAGIAWFLNRSRAGCCGRSEKRPPRRTRWATTCVAYGSGRCSSAVRAAGWPAPSCRWCIPPCGSRTWSQAGAG